MTCEFDIVLEKIQSNIKSVPTLYYVGIGTANHETAYPTPENRHELPDYILELDYQYKVLILIDPATTIPLKYSPYTVINIDDIMYKIIELDIDIFVIRQIINIDIHDNFLYMLIKSILHSHQDTLMMCSTYTGIPIYHKQDIIINLFEPVEQFNIRSRFLLDTKYYKDLGCRYDLTNPLNQPIIQNNRFYNPGYLLPEEFDEELKQIYQKIDLISLQKKSFLKSLYDVYLVKYLGQTYINYRRIYNEATDIHDKKYFRELMLEIINNMIQCLRTFINTDEFINKLRNENIYYDINELKSIFNMIDI